MTEATEKIKHCLELTAQLNDLRKQKVLCDVTLFAGGETFPAHRNVLAVSCPYFYKLFTSDMREKTSETVNLEALEVSANVIDTLLTYLYTGMIDVTQLNAEEILISADYFLITEVKLMASEELISKTDVSNCLYYLDFAERYNCERLAQASRLFTEKHFQEVTQSDDFLKLGAKEVKDIISSDNIFVEKEEVVYESLITWIEHNRGEREVYFPSLLACIRFCSLSHEYIQTHVIKNSLVQEHSSCIELVEKAVDSNASSEVLFSQKPRKCLQPAIDVVITICGAQKSRDTQQTSVRCYVPEENNWFEMKHFPNQINWHGFVEHERELYTVGGERNGMVSKALEKFNLKTNTWTSMSPMLKEVLFPAVASLGNCIYVIGASRVNRGTLQIYVPSINIWTLGTQLNVPREITCAVSDGRFLYAIGGMRAGDGEYLSSVERYDPEQDTWTDIPPMLQPRGGACAVSSESFIYVMGGECNVRIALSSCEVYSTVSEQWQSIVSMHVPRYFAGAAIIGKTIYVFGGVGGSNVTLEQRKVVERYDMDQGVWSADITMPWEAKYLRCCLLCLRRDFVMGLPEVVG